MFLAIIPFYNLPSGSQADWVQIVISLLGILGLFWIYKTFKLQQETYLLQLKVTDIEQKRFIREIRPDIKMDLDWDFKRLKLKTINSVLHRTTFEITDLHEHVIFNDHVLNWNKEMDLPVDTEINIHFAILDNVEDETVLFCFFVIYQDELANRYIKTIQVISPGAYKVVGPMLGKVDSVRLDDSE